MKQFEDVFARYSQIKDQLYKIYTESLWLEEGYVKSTTKYLDDFFKTINDRKKLKNEFQYPCQSDGTGNVVIQGLKKN